MVRFVLWQVKRSCTADCNTNPAMARTTSDIGRIRRTLRAGISRWIVPANSESSWKSPLKGRGDLKFPLEIKKWKVSPREREISQDSDAPILRMLWRSEEHTSELQSRVDIS